jgi:capsule polysaccharide export protein KpsE/RkpR
VTDIATFYATVQRIERLMNHLSNEAREMPGQYARRVDSLRVSATHYSRVSEEQEALAAALQKAMRAKEIARSEAERDTKLREIAAELESLRAVLPGLAAQVSIEMGVTARALVEEARQ